MKIRAMALASMAAMLWASVATAGVSFTIIGTSGGDPNALGVGEQITIDIRIANDGSDGPIFGIGASVSGYDEGMINNGSDDFIAFVSGEAVDGYLFDTCIEGTGCFNGLSNTASGALGESAITGFPDRVQIANSAGLDGRTGDGTLDPGLDGVVGGGDVQFQLVFEGVQAGTSTLNIGTGYQGDVVVLEGGATAEARSPGSSRFDVGTEPGFIQKTPLEAARSPCSWPLFVLHPRPFSSGPATTPYPATAQDGPRRTEPFSDRRRSEWVPAQPWPELAGRRVRAHARGGATTSRSRPDPVSRVPLAEDGGDPLGRSYGGTSTGAWSE